MPGIGHYQNLISVFHIHGPFVADASPENSQHKGKQRRALLIYFSE